MIFRRFRIPRFYLSLFILLLAATFSIADDSVVDVTDLVEVTQSRMRYDRRAATSYLDVTLTNTSEKALVGPVLLVVDSITSDSVTVKEPDGTTEDGMSYITVVENDAVLQAGASSESKRLTFGNSARARFSFTTSAWSLVSRAVNSSILC